MNDWSRPRPFIDADVLFAGAASPTVHGASLVVLRMAEITLIEAITCQQVISEVERNLRLKVPAALPAFRLLVSRSLRVTPTPDRKACRPFQSLADAKDLPILVAAIGERCPYLLSFNTRHFQPGHPDVTVLPPGQFLQGVRHLLAQL